MNVNLVAIGYPSGPIVSSQLATPMHQFRPVRIQIDPTQTCELRLPEQASLRINFESDKPLEFHFFLTRHLAVRSGTSCSFH